MMHPEASRRTILLVGPGDYFLSGISYHTVRLADALAENTSVALLLLRRICPKLVYPGRKHVGKMTGALPLPAAPVFDGLDWYWGLSILRMIRFWRRTKPEIVILQWWTGAVLHSYLVLVSMAIRREAKIIVEFHEVQDVGEAVLPLTRRYTAWGMRWILRRADAAIVHSEFDRHAIETAYPDLARIPVAVIPPGSFDQYRRTEAPNPRRPHGCLKQFLKPGPIRLLTFGVVRPHKGHAQLVEAVHQLLNEGIDLHVSVVGEVWQGYRDPLERLRTLLAPDRLAIVDRYIPDAEVTEIFSGTDIVVLPYHRASASGPLQIARSLGLPVVTTAVGGLVQATEGYTGAVLVPPKNSNALASGIRKAIPLIGRKHADIFTWSDNATEVLNLTSRLGYSARKDGETAGNLVGADSL